LLIELLLGLFQESVESSNLVSNVFLYALLALLDRLVFKDTFENICENLVNSVADKSFNFGGVNLIVSY